MPEPSAIEGVLRSLVEAMEAREAAEPDLPEWEARDRMRVAEKDLLKLYRESGQIRSARIAIDISVDSVEAGISAAEVA